MRGISPIFDLAKRSKSGAVIKVYWQGVYQSLLSGCQTSLNLHQCGIIWIWYGNDKRATMTTTTTTNKKTHTLSGFFSHCAPDRNKHAEDRTKRKTWTNWLCFVGIIGPSDEPARELLVARFSLQDSRDYYNIPQFYDPLCIHHT